MSAFEVSDRVEKYKGDYRASGTVIAVGIKKSGKRLYMVEYDDISGLVHIHSDFDLRALKEQK